MATQCSHLNQIQVVTPSADGCEDCLKMGDPWVHLRLCQICGHVVALNLVSRSTYELS
jgi:hypothetical protein